MSKVSCEDIVSKIDYAFQPIVNINSGRVVAYEALLRDYKNAGFSSIEDFFNAAYEAKILYKLDLLLREKAIKKFIDATFDKSAKIFYNLDNRIIEMNDYKTGATSEILDRLGVKKSIIAFEISEKFEFKSFLKAQEVFNLYQQQGYQIAIDDFGTGFSGLKLLYHSEPNYLKIDRFFIQDICTDRKKKLFISNIITIAHTIGAIVIAEGVETKEEFFVCKEIGCDCIQGYFVERPQTDVLKLRLKYSEVKELSMQDKKSKIEKNSIKKYVKNVKTVSLNSKMSAIFEIFKNSQNSYLVVVDEINRPIGILKEKKLRKYIYNPFGSTLLTNKRLSEKKDDFLTKCSSVEIYSNISKILKAFSYNNEAEGVVVTKNFEYYGFIDAKNILHYLNNKNIADARNQNPLSGLPGNKKVEEFIRERLENKGSSSLFTYFDFDNFKPFNDLYGFRNGDRAILLFADIMRKKFKNKNYFIGHIGGDDFFMGCEINDECSFEDVYSDISKTINSFSKDIESFYSYEDIQRGYYVSKNRDGVSQKFSFMTVSAATICLNRATKNSYLPDNELSCLLASMKKIAKNDISHMMYASIT